MIDLEIYQNRHNTKYPEHIIKVLKRVDNLIYFETEFGVCKKEISNIGICSYNLSSAIDKTDYLKKQLFKIHRDNYDYSLVEWKNSHYKITLICKKHGLFKVNTNSAVHNKSGCKKCGSLKISKSLSSNTIEFIKKANKIHNNKYDYSNTNYKNSTKKVNIICKQHGIFQQRASHHLQKHGCKKCASKTIGNINQNNPPGWNLKHWIDNSKKSKNFDSYKVYIIKCWNDNEEFYKIGRSFKTVQNRFKNKSTMPYQYETIKIYEDTAKIIYEMEKELKNKNKEYLYLPKLKFNGMYECFRKII